MATANYDESLRCTGHILEESVINNLKDRIEKYNQNYKNNLSQNTAQANEQLRKDFAILYTVQPPEMADNSWLLNRVLVKRELNSWLDGIKEQVMVQGEKVIEKVKLITAEKLANLRKQYEIVTEYETLLQHCIDTKSPDIERVRSIIRNHPLIEGGTPCEADDLSVILPNVTQFSKQICNIHITSDKFEPKLCTVNGLGRDIGPYVIMFGRPFNIRVNIKDTFCNARNVSRDKVNIMLSVPLEGTLLLYPFANVNGSRYIDYQPTKPGIYNMKIVVNHIPIANSPFDVTVLGNCDLSNVLVDRISCQFSDKIWGIAVDCTGRILVADREKNHIKVLNKYHKFQKVFGEYGDTAGKFDCPVAVAISQDGTVYVSDKENHRVEMYTHEFEYLDTIGKEKYIHISFRYPFGIAVNRHVLAVADNGNNRVVIIDVRCKSILKSFNTNCPRGICLDRITGYLFISNFDESVVNVYETEGYSFITRFGNQLLQKPQGMISYDSENLILLDSNNSTIRKYKKYVIRGDRKCQYLYNGELKGIPIMGMKKPADVASSVDGRILYVTDYEEKCIWALTIRVNSLPK